MSESINTQYDSKTLRWQLLATASAIALLAFGYPAGEARASDGDADQPILWIELGGQFDRLQDGQEQFNLPFFADIPKAGLTAPYTGTFPKTVFTSPLALEKPPLYSIEEDGKVSFQPRGSDWFLSASIRYGRSKSNKYLHQQTNITVPLATETTGIARRYAQTKTNYSEAHAIADFMAGKDVGLGMLGMKGDSTLNVGLRFAQFRSRSSISINADPDYMNRIRTSGLAGAKYRHNFSAQAQNAHNFTGIGPAIAWDASATVVGDSQIEKISVDWGLNGALLFGRQKMQGHHQATGHFQSGISFPPFGLFPMTTHYTHAGNPSRSRSVVVPNVSGFAGVSFRLADAKVSFGYRGDFFIGAIDGGLDTAKSYNRGFYGPFANFSIGIGD